MTQLFNFFRKIYNHRSLIALMAVREIQYRYAGTVVGFFWSVVNPIAIIAVYWFVFSVGFRVQAVGGMPFIVVFVCGLIPWQFFNETLIANNQSIVSNMHLVKKTTFPTEILSVVNLFASMLIHGLMLVIFFIIMLTYGIGFSLYNLQFLYYLLAMSVFAVGLGWIFAALNAIYRDVGQILGVLLNIWFWLTPVVWDADMMPAYKWILRLNPMYYIVEGYKASFIHHALFWNEPVLGVYFWTISLSVFVIGGMVFKRLKHEFVEAL